MLALLSTFKKQRQLSQWKKRYDIKKKEKQFCSLFKNSNGFLLSQKAREHILDDSLLYGEIHFVSFALLLNLISPTKEDIFYDLGSGIGKAVLCACLVFPFKAAYGIECLDTLHLEACQIKNNSSVAIKSQIHFIHGDFLNTCFLQATVIFINATAFFGERWEMLIEKLKTLKSGTRLIISSRKLPQRHFDLMQKNRTLMSWGACNTYVYRKI